MLPIPRSANTPPVRCRHKVGGEQPPSAEQPARCASIRLLLVMDESKPHFALAPACRGGNVSASAKFPTPQHFFHIVVLLMPSRPTRLLSPSMLHNCCVVMAAGRELKGRCQHPITRNVSG